MPSLFTFAARRPGLYLALCAGTGLTLRWFWVGRDLARFFNPLAPLFA